MIRSLRTGGPALAIALILAVLAIVALVTAYSYSRSSGLFPIFVGWIFLALTLVEVVVQLRALRQPTPSDVAEPAAEKIDVLSEFGGFLWLGLMLVVLHAAGFLIATPVFVFAFLRFAARRTVVQSVAIALLATAFVYVVFAWLLDYELYAGVLFGG